MYKFEWDENKNRTNKTKHGIAFDVVKSVFFDEEAIVQNDQYHSTKTENRLFIIGESSSKKVISVSYLLKDDDTIRIITARKSSKKEKQIYEKRKFN